METLVSCGVCDSVCVQWENWSPSQVGPFPWLPTGISIFISPRASVPKKNWRKIWGSCQPCSASLMRIAVALATPAFGSQVPGGMESSLTSLPGADKSSGREGPAVEPGALTSRPLCLMGDLESQASPGF